MINALGYNKRFGNMIGFSIGVALRARADVMVVVSVTVNVI